MIEDAYTVQDRRGIRVSIGAEGTCRCCDFQNEPIGVGVSIPMYRLAGKNDVIYLCSLCYSAIVAVRRANWMIEEPVDDNGKEDI